MQIKTVRRHFVAIARQKIWKFNNTKQRLECEEIRSLKHSIGSVYIGTNTLGGKWYPKINLRIDLFVKLTNNYSVLAVSGTIIGTENDAKNKPNQLPWSLYSRQKRQLINKETASYSHPSTDYSYEEK